MMPADPVIIERIRKLITLAEHETTNASEARNARARAVELLNKHGIESDADAGGNITLELDRRLANAVDDYKDARRTVQSTSDEYRRRDRETRRDFDRGQRDAERSRAEAQFWGRGRRFF